MKKMVYRFLQATYSIILGSCLGLFLLAIYASYSDAVRQEIKKSVQQTFKQQFDCEWDGTVSALDFINLQIEFTDVSLLPCDSQQTWSLYARSFYIKAYWLDFIMSGLFSCHGYFDQVLIDEQQVDNCSYFKLLLKKMFSSHLPGNVSFDYMTIKQGKMILHDAPADLAVEYTYNCQMSREKDEIHTQLYVLDGQVTYKNKVMCDSCVGNLVLIYPHDADLDEIYARVDFRLNFPDLQEKGNCFLVGDLYQSRGAFVVSNEDQSFIIEPLKIQLAQDAIPCTCSVSMHTDIVQKLVLPHDMFDPNFSGNLTCKMVGNLLDLRQNLQLDFYLDHLVYKNNSLMDKVLLHVVEEQDDYRMDILMQQETVLQGTGKYHDNRFDFAWKNSKELHPFWTSYWKILAGKGSVQGSFDLASWTLQAEHQVQLHSDKLDEDFAMQGQVHFNSQELSCAGLLADRRYELLLQFQPKPYLKKLRYYDADEVFIDLHEQDVQQGTAGFVGFNYLKNLLPEPYKASFLQPAKFEMQGQLQAGSYHTQVLCKDAYMRVPFMYNVVQNFTAHAVFDFMGRSLVVENLFANLYEGVIRCDRAVSSFNPQSQQIFLHAPLLLDHVLMSWNKGIFGTVSGRLFLMQHEQQPLQLQGNLIVDNAQIKGNIFSQEFQNQLAGAVSDSPSLDVDAQLDINIETKEPIQVETSFLQALVHVDLHVGNSIKQPEVEGTIDIASGELKFPYKSLFITRGQISIMPKNSTEPTFEFVAKGKIKRYNITMRASGTMLDQQIHFESSPYLTEEQIISLLLIGSQDSSLSVVMPAMLMQKLQEIIFGPALSQSKLDVMFHRILQSFKNIRIYPQFSNQTGRGGVRGIIEVDATDRLHGKVDTNLMQLEDTIFEADYLLTDDVTVRAIKDGPSTYGGEVEMRWKFS